MHPRNIFGNEIFGKRIIKNSLKIELHLLWTLLTEVKKGQELITGTLCGWQTCLEVILILRFTT